MAEVKKSSVEWMQEPHYQNVVINSPDGWNRKDLKGSFNEEQITETEFRKRLKDSSALYPPKEMEQKRND